MTTMMIKGMAITGLMTLSACATHNATSDWPGYRTDSAGNVQRTADGHCWRTAYWTAAMAAPECDVAITGVPEPEPKAVEAAADAVADEPLDESMVLPDLLAIEFAFDSAVITAAHQAALKAWYQQVMALNGVDGPDNPTVYVDGYSDPLGDTGYNRTLAKQRAEAVAQWWQQQGESMTPLDVQWHGPDSAMTGSRCEGLQGGELRQCHQQDRRVVLQVNAPSKD